MKSPCNCACGANGVFFGQIQRVATRVLCNSSFTASFVSDLEPRLTERVRVVHDGVDAVAPAHPVGGPVGAGTPLEIVCVGRLHPQKGQQASVDALHLGVGGGHDWRVHFWGDALPEHESLAADLRAAVSAAALDDRVVWHGYGADADAMYAGMDVAVVPSTWPEGFSSRRRRRPQVSRPSRPCRVVRPTSSTTAGPAD